MDKPASSSSPRVSRLQLSGKRPLALSAVALISLLACVQTEPEDTKSVPVEDNGRRAGATSSTNWPTKSGNPYQIKAYGRSDSTLRMYFFKFLPTTGNIPLKLKGKVSFYRSNVIPALDSVNPMIYEFQESDTLEVSNSILVNLPSNGSDTISFNIHLVTDSGSAWFLDFKYSKKEWRFLQSPFSNLSEPSAYLEKTEYFFKGNLRVDTGTIPTLPGKSEFCFYIPGTPIFGMARIDSPVKIGPLSHGKYPLRLMRITQLDSKPGETLVEAWEVLAGLDFEGDIKPGEMVLTVHSKGVLALRNAE